MFFHSFPFSLATLSSHWIYESEGLGRAVSLEGHLWMWNHRANSGSWDERVSIGHTMVQFVKGRIKNKSLVFFVENSKGRKVRDFGWESHLFRRRELDGGRRRGWRRKRFMHRRFVRRLRFTESKEAEDMISMKRLAWDKVVGDRSLKKVKVE